MPAAEALARRLRNTGGDTVAVPIDVSDVGSVGRAVASVKSTLGPIDVLVNNAGIDQIEPFVESEESTWRRIVDVNYLGAVACARAVLDGMLDRGAGRIVSIASDAGKVGSSGEVVYSGTKGALIAFSKALARETARRGVTVNCVCPGPTDTSLLDQIAERSQQMYDSLIVSTLIGPTLTA